MSNDIQQARDLVKQALEGAAERDAMARALLNAVVEAMHEFRSGDDIASELHYLADNMDEDEFVITRGC